MRGIWELYRADLRRATSNVMSVIVLCGLIVIPSAFTWFNVIGSWVNRPGCRGGSEFPRG